MSTTTRREIRFYVCLILGYVLLILGFYAPPLGIIANSVLWGSGILFSIGGLAVGIDLKGILHEINDLRRLRTLGNENEKADE